MLKLGLGVEWIRRHDHCARLHRAEEGDGELWHIRQAERDAVAMFDAKREQRPREVVRQRAKLRIRDRRPVILDGRAGAVAADRLIEERSERGGWDSDGLRHALGVVRQPRSLAGPFRTAGDGGSLVGRGNRGLVHVTRSSLSEFRKWTLAALLSAL